MKKVFTLLTVILVIFLSACSPETVEEPETVRENVTVIEEEYGSLTVTASSSQRTIEPSYSDRHTVSYVIHVDSTSSGYSNTFTTAEESCTIDNLVAGDYTVYVEGLNAAGSAIVKSDTQTVTIVNRKTTSASFKLNRYVEGNGRISFTVAVPKNDDSVDGVVFTLYKASDTALENPEEYGITADTLSDDGKYRCYVLEKSLASGSYNLVAGMFRLNDDDSRTQVGFTHIDAVHIYKGLESESTLVWDKEFFPAVTAPVIDTVAGTYKDGQTVRITCSDSRATIYYTLDGTTPTADSAVYTEPIVLEGSAKLRAVAVIEGLVDSFVASADYTVYVENPVFSIPDNTLVNGDYLTLTSETAGAKIIYTTDGTEPTPENGTEYTASFKIRKTMTVKARAYKDGYEPSSVISSTYYDTNTPTDDSYFDITDKGAVSVKSGKENSIPSVLIIPESVKGIDVVEIAANGFSDLTGIKYLSIPETVTKIGNSAFSGCTNIESLSIASSVTKIGDNAFAECTKVASVSISEAVTTLSSTAFYGWTADQRINDYSGLIKAGTLTDCQAKIYITVKAGTQTIGGYTGMDTLYGISLPNSVTTITDNAFSGCTNLEEFTLPSYVTSIGSYAFNDCTKIESITLPNVLDTLASNAFKGWTESQKIIDNSGLAITDGKFSDSSAKVYTTTPTTMTEITTDTVRNRDDIYGLEIKAAVKTIGDNAFEGTSIESITIPETVETMGLDVFKGWTADQKVEVVYNGYTATVSSDGNTTPFTNSNADYSVAFASGITEIKSNAFNGMSTLDEVSIPDTVTVIGDNAFKSTALNTVSLSPDTTTIGTGAFESCLNLTSITIPDKVTSIGSRAYYNDNALKTITVPDSVTSIGDEIFADCDNLESVTLGAGITSIPKKAFEGSDKLTSITAPSCMGSLTVTVKVPLEQLIVHDIYITVSPEYSTAYGYTKEITRDELTIDGNYRVYNYSVDSLLGLYYKVNIELKDYNDVRVGGNYLNVQVSADNVATANFSFTTSSLTTRTLSSTTITPTGNTYLDGDEITITNADADAIYYTTDGTTPTEYNGTRYAEPLVFHEFANIRAVAVKEGYSYSPVAATYYYYIKPKAPTYNLDSNTVYPSTQYLELATDTEGASIYYSMGSSTSMTLYTGPVAISSTTTIKAIARKTGFADSDATTVTITIDIPQHNIEIPSFDALSINWTKTGTTFTFTPVLTSGDSNALYEWYLDGNLVSSSSVWETSEDLTFDIHLLELKGTVDGISYSSYLLTDVLRFTYRVNLNSQWVKDTSYTNPDSKLYDGVYKSYSNYNVASSTATMYIYVKGCGDFSIYIRSYAQTTNDYVKVYALDSSSTLKASTSGNQTSSRTISGYTKVTFSIPADGKEHSIQIAYIKNASTNSNEDRGFVLIPMNQ